MYYAYDLTGQDFPVIRTMEIASNQAITLGQVVKLSGGNIIPAVVGETTAIVGIAGETHSGVADSLNTRSNGTQIRCYVSSTAVFACSAPQLTATGGSATTVAASALATFADDDFNGGYLKLIKKGGTSTITDPIGSVYKITDFVGSTKTFTLGGGIPGNASAGDVFALFPPDAFSKGNFSANLQNIDYSGAVGTIAKIVESDLNTNTLFWTPALHTFDKKAV